MNWEAIGAVAELVGAIAVVASLLYLAIQVRHSTEVSRATAFQAIFDGVTTHNNYMFGPDNVDLVIRCLRSYPDVGVEDRMVYDNLMANLMNYFEASYEAADAQTLDRVPDVLDGVAIDLFVLRRQKRLVDQAKMAVDVAYPLEGRR